MVYLRLRICQQLSHFTKITDLYSSRNNIYCHLISGERTRRLSEENRATKGKMIQIQQKMRERRMRLQAKREAKTTSQYPPTNYSPNSKKKHLSSSSKSTSRKPATKDAPAVKSTDTQMSATAVSDATDVTMAGDTSSAMYEDYKPGAMVA